MPGGVHVEVRELVGHLPRVGLHLPDPLDLVPPELDPDDPVRVGRDEVDDIPLHPELPRPEVEVVPLVLDLHEPLEDLPPGEPGMGPELEAQVPVVRGVPEAVDAGDRGHDDDVLPAHERRGGGHPVLLDLGVDLGVLLDVLVLLGDVGLGLVVVIVRDEVLHVVFGEELPELVVELGSEGLVVGDDERGLFDGLDHVRHRVGLPRPGHPEEGLVVRTRPEALDELRDGLGLVAGRLEGSCQPERCHGA